MKVLGCSLASPGFTAPVIRALAGARQRLGASVAIATGLGLENWCARAGVQRLPRGEVDGDSFGPSVWAKPLHIAMQVKHIEHALATFGADILVTNHLGIGAMIVAEREKIPLVVIGGPSFLYPMDAEDRDGRRTWTIHEITGALNTARGLFGLAVASDAVAETPLLGDCFMLQLPLELANAVYRHLPERVVCTGAFTWEAARPSDDLRALLAAARRASYVAYVQFGRLFNTTDPWPRVAGAFADMTVALIVGHGRRDDPIVTQAKRRIYVTQEEAQDAILDVSDFVISTGHPTSVLGALTHGLPLVLIPNGSGTFDTADICETLGVGVRLDWETFGSDDVRLAFELLVRDGRASAASLNAVRAYSESDPEQTFVDALLRLTRRPVAL